MCCVNSFVEAEHVLDGIHDGRFAVLVAILGNLLLILLFRVRRWSVASALVVPAKPQHHVPVGPGELAPHNLLARYFNNIDCHLCLHRRDLHKQNKAVVRSSRPLMVLSVSSQTRS